MPPKRNLFTRMKHLIGERVSTTSLQFRLTLEVALLSTLGLSSVALWSAWRMEQALITSHKDTLEYVAAHFPEQVAMDSEMQSLKAGLQHTVGKTSTIGLLMWVKSVDGKLLAQSPGLKNPSPELARLLTVTDAPESPEMVEIDDLDILLCATPLTLRGQTVGKVYLAQEVTHDQRRLNTGLLGLLIVSLLATLLLTVTIAHRIRSALTPLEQMSQAASKVSADDLATAKLQLQQAPDEILGLAQAFNEMLGRLSLSWDQQRQFVGNASHELRTPLTVVAGYLQSLLRRSTNLNDYQQQALETAVAETERTIRMLEDLLDLARADSGNLHFRQDPVFLNTLVVEVAEMSRKVSQRSINVIATSEDVVALADQDRLQQVLINLVDNAIKYSAPDQSVDLLLEKTDQQAIVHVRDRGMGISLPHQNRIFERFYRVDESRTRSRDGTGLGLAIAKSLIEGMAGRITVRSTPGEGSLFTLSLPLWPAAYD